MAESLDWNDLLEVYRNAHWLRDDEADVTLATTNIVKTFQLVEKSDKAEADANLAALTDPNSISVGQIIRARIGSPRLSLGVLSDTWEAHLGSPEARIKEPAAYFVKEDASYAGMEPASDRMVSYRKMLDFVGLLAGAALFLDIQRQTLVYFKEKKIDVPVRFAARDFKSISSSDIEILREALEGQVHTEQKHAIFADAVVTLAASQTADNRFLYLAQNADELSRRVKDGYRLFASSFSYAKIRGEVESAQADYVSRIHKTFVDIQGQLLGLPVATVVVATQLKAASTCGVEAWANLAVLVGAWLFAALLTASCINQLFTLGAIRADVSRQKIKLNRDFSEISLQFNNVFDKINSRASWHRIIMISIILIAFTGGVFATLAYRSLTTVNIIAICMK